MTMTAKQAVAIAEAAYDKRETERAAWDAERKSPGIQALRHLRAVAQRAATRLDDLLDEARLTGAK
jgi:hypothetical protein